MRIRIIESTKVMSPKEYDALVNQNKQDAESPAPAGGDPGMPQLDPEAMKILQQGRTAPATGQSGKVPVFGDQELTNFQKQYGNSFLQGIGWRSIAKKTTRPYDQMQLGRLHETVDPGPAIAQASKKFMADGIDYISLKIPGRGTPLTDQNDGRIIIRGNPYKKAGAEGPNAADQTAFLTARFLRTILHLLNDAIPENFPIDGKNTVNQYIQNKQKELEDAAQAMKEKRIKLAVGFDPNKTQPTAGGPGNAFDKQKPQVYRALTQQATPAERQIIAKMGQDAQKVIEYDPQTGTAGWRPSTIDYLAEREIADTEEDIFYVMQNGKRADGTSDKYTMQIKNNVDAQRRKIFQEIVDSIEIVMPTA